MLKVMGYEYVTYQFVYDYVKSRKFIEANLKMDSDVAGFEEYQRNILQLKPDELVEWYFVAVLDIDLDKDDDEDGPY